MDGYLERDLPELAALPVPLIVNVMGFTREEVGRLVTAFAARDEVAALELNVSCPNVESGLIMGADPGETAALLEHVRPLTEKPLIVKLSPDFAETNEREIIPAALDAGVRIVNYGNTRKVVNSRLSQGEGGLSGPDIFPTTLENLRRTRRVFGKNFDIIATGGVDSPDKAAQLLDEGATAVGYFTGFVTRGPILARLILERLVASR